MIGSDRYVTVSGKPVLGRKTKWGLIEGKENLQTFWLVEIKRSSQLRTLLKRVVVNRT